MAIDRQRIYHKRERLKQLRAFCCVAKLGSVTRASEHLGILQPMVSMHIRELEYELEAVLFDRGPRSVSLTLAGERFYGLTAPLVEGAQEIFVKDWKRHDDSLHGRLRLAAGMAVTSFVLPPYIKRFRDRFPDVRVRVKDCSPSEGVGLLLRNEVDFVLGVKDRHPEDAIEYRHFSAYDTVLITSRDHPLAGRGKVRLEDAAAWPLIVPSANSHGGTREDTLATRFGHHSSAVIEVNGWTVVKRYVETGLGISLVPDICLLEGDPLAVIPLDDCLPSGSFGIRFCRNQMLTSIARRFLKFMTQARLRQ